MGVENPRTNCKEYKAEWRSKMDGRIIKTPGRKPKKPGRTQPIIWRTNQFNYATRTGCGKEGPKRKNISQWKETQHGNEDMAEDRERKQREKPQETR